MNMPFTSPDIASHGWVDLKCQFVGSGTTLVEAIHHRRYAIGIDIDAGYVNMAMKRIEKECALFVTHPTPEYSL